MKKEDLFDAVTEIDDRHIAHAEQHLFRRPLAWKQIGALAACGVLAIGLTQFIPTGGGSSDAAAEAPAAGAPDSVGSSDVNDGSFDSYAPPVLPLFFSGEGAEELECERTLTFDYSASDSYSGTYAAAAQVTDSYVLMNSTDGEILAVVSYPSGGTLTDPLPALTVDGAASESTFAFSEILAAFRTEASGERWNIGQPQTAEYYSAVMEAAITRPQADAETPALDETVTVYTFTDVSRSDANAATLQYQYTCDPDRTTVLSYGFNGFSGNENGMQAHDFFVNENFAPNTRMLIVLGDDIESGTLQGYRNGACTPGEELDGLTARVTRTESTLGEALAVVVQRNMERRSANGMDVSIPFADYYTAVTGWYALHGPTGSDPVERYEDGRLDDLVDEVLAFDRVRWQTIEVLIPAGESRTIEAVFRCRGSFNYPGSGGDPDVYGYSFMTIAPPNSAWPTTLRFVNTAACEGASCMLATTEGVIDTLELHDDPVFTLSPATGYHSFTLRDK